MTLSTFDCIAAITAHSAGFAEAARRQPRRPGRALPGLVGRRPGPAPHRGALVLGHDRRGAARRAAGRVPPPARARPTPSSSTRSWPAPPGWSRCCATPTSPRPAGPGRRWQQDVAFVTRHQVQEAAVHHWDAVNAAGDALVIDPAVAADSRRRVPAVLGGLGGRPRRPAGSRRSTARSGSRHRHRRRLDAHRRRTPGHRARRHAARPTARSWRRRRRGPAAVALRPDRPRHLRGARRPARPVHRADFTD